MNKYRYQIDMCKYKIKYVVICINIQVYVYEHVII